MNPYEAPPTAVDVSPTAVSSGTSLIWFAATVAGLTAATSLFTAIHFWGWGDASTIFVHTLLPTTLAIPAVVIYASVSHTFRKHFDFSSTPMSLVVAGAIVALYMAVVHFLTFGPFTQYRVWLLGLIIGIPLCYIVSAVERLVAGPAADHTAEPSAISTQGDAHASIFWFSGACLAFGFLLGAATQPGPSLYTTLMGGVIGSAMMCVVGTAVYGALGAVVKRSQAATRESRCAAAAAFVGLAYLAGFLMEAMAVPAGLPRLLVIVGILPLCVFVDRLVANRAARTG